MENSPLPSDGRDPQAHLNELIATIREVADKLHSESTPVGDLKILSRTIRELRYAFKVFAPYRGCRKVSVFGSARTPSHAPTYQSAVDLGKAFAEQEWMVVTGAANGIMEAGHRGAGREHSMGLNIMLPFEQGTNSIISGDPKLVHMKYFFTRKLMFVKECDAVVCLPGGYGTLDEFMEVLTLLQTGKRDIIPIVLLDEPGGRYWQALQEFIDQHLLGGKMISPEDYALYYLTDDYRQAVAHVTQFYQVYHSMRYVRKKLVLRLNDAPPPKLFHDIQEAFADLLAEDAFELSPPLPAEKDEPQLAHLPRLIFSYNRRNLGRLRMLIDCLNRGSV